MVCCYTNHALDQFLEDLLRQGIPEKDMVRLGPKPSPSTANMALSAQIFEHRFESSDWEFINYMKSSLNHQGDVLQRAFSEYQQPLRPSRLLNHLESITPLTSRHFPSLLPTTI